ncbi:hypothetical protein [Leptothoe spongobia]|uniref:Uncharacterized protein n=1 Tax=Leptothoe spongobia TAU-MAC 1115 TaxID=1967444 RepID=A0A947DFA9_9CYAN|nr:hypothetical protein [Leptothoe spongobia]MBT9315826.1 hypothetical protein [Leptothoe spongobia TAU-MAC 1115]
MLRKKDEAHPSPISYSLMLRKKDEAVVTANVSSLSNADVSKCQVGSDSGGITHL